jgi:hypothetical protein
MTAKEVKPIHIESDDPSSFGLYDTRESVVITLTGSAFMADKNRDKPPLVVDADKFDSVLKRLIEHKPVPKKSLRTSRKTKRGKILSK